MSAYSIRSLAFQVQSYLLPNLNDASDTHLHRLRALTKVVMGAAGTVSGLLTAYTLAALKDQKDKKEANIPVDLSTALKNVTLGICSGASIFATGQLYDRIQQIDRILHVADLDFMEIHRSGLLHRLPVAVARAKFLEMANRSKWIIFGNELDLPDLVKRGIAKPEDCRYETYEIDLKKITLKRLEAHFPLLSEVHSEHSALQQEALRQQKQYLAIKPISDRYPDREHDFGGHMFDTWHWRDNPGLERLAKQQQSGYEEEIAQLQPSALSRRST